jgi:hypothetical protein
MDTRTHVIMHLENTIEMQDDEHEERVETIANLEQQLQVLQLQVPPTPEDRDEADAMSGADED